MGKEGRQSGPFGKFGKAKLLTADTPFSDPDAPDQGQGRLVFGRFRRHMRTEKRHVDEEPVARDAAEKPSVYRGHQREAEKKLALTRCEIGKPCRFERRIEQPLCREQITVCLHRRKKSLYSIRLLLPDPIKGSQLLNACRELGNSGQEREQPLGIGRERGDAFFPASKGMETEKGLIRRHGHSARPIGNTAGPVVVERKDGRQKTAESGMDDVVQEVTAAARHRDDRKSAHIGIMAAESSNKGIRCRIHVIQRECRMVTCSDFIGNGHVVRLT